MEEDRREENKRKQGRLVLECIAKQNLKIINTTKGEIPLD